MSDVPVNVDNFVRAETDRMFEAILQDGGGVNQWMHNRVPTPLDHQPVIRMNRDTLYSATVVDLSEGATLTLPDGGDRYVSAMIVNEDHYINEVFHKAGDHELSVAKFDTPYVLVGVRILVDPARDGDVATVNALQNQIGLTAKSANEFRPPAYDQASLSATRTALLDLAKGLGGFDHAFGRKEDVNQVRHLIASAAGWGGLPEQEAYYINVAPDLPVGHYELTVRDVPVDGFWSISLYNAGGYLADNGQPVSVNNLSAEREPDGSVTVNFGGEPGTPNLLPIMDGWNYLVRLYRPRPEVLNGDWTFPPIKV
ncbi:DUF1254 domain-containing protein [Jatrophihabitans sp. DSM 45814]